MNPRYIIVLFVHLAVTSCSANVLTDIQERFENAYQTVSHGVEEGALETIGSQCENVKKLLGITYYQLNDTDRPDTSKLLLEYRNKNKTVLFNLTTAAEDILSSDKYDDDKNLIIFLHGYTDNPNKTNFAKINDAILSSDSGNILALDSSSLINSKYLLSSTYVVFIGEVLAEALVSFNKMGVKSSQMHLIGHSLGGHIAGYAGKTYYSLTGEKFGRISGLDPAGPCFLDLSDANRLNSTDAEFVDVMHTDAGVNGIDDEIGQVDYYPNGGKIQPGCTDCYHQRTVDYYAESFLNQTGFLAVKCDSWSDFKDGKCDTSDTSYMGIASTPGTTGKYYLKTGSEYPFALGENGITDD